MILNSKNNKKTKKNDKYKCKFTLTRINKSKPSNIRKNKRAFTLIELIIVIIVIGILAGMAIPKFTGIIRNSRVAAMQRDLDVIEKAVLLYENDQENTNDYPFIENIEKNNEKYKKVEVSDEIKTVLSEFGDDSSKIYEIDLSKLSPYISKLKYKDDVFLYSTNTDKAIYQKGQVDGKGITRYVIDSNGGNIEKKDYSEYLEWLKNTDLIVTNPSDPIYNGINPEYGEVILGYDKLNPPFGDLSIKSMSSSNAKVGYALLEAYNQTKEEIYLTRAKAVGDYILNRKYSFTLYGSTITMFNPMNQYNKETNTWLRGNNIAGPGDSLYSVGYLIELSAISGENKYANGGKEVIDSCIILQNIVAGDNFDEPMAGALPASVGKDINEDGSNIAGLTWGKYPLDGSYGLSLASDAAYEYFKDDKYKDFKDKYYKFVDNVLDNYTGMNEYGIPFELIRQNGDTYEGVNINNFTQELGKTEPITIDQLFYTILGIQQSDSKYKDSFTDMLNRLQFDNGMFWGEYTHDGKHDPSISNDIELINSAFYIRYLRKYNSPEIENIKSSIDRFKETSDTDVNVNNSWSWAPNYRNIDSVTTSVIIEEFVK